ncbi:MAG: DUF1800 domain-containing protein [Saprospiraceae bacterium]|nr:DUF1800 domain-containing protein [Saprospiraceae bacterium]
MKRSEFLNKFRPTLEQAPMPPASLDPYSGPWTRTQVTHLLRRTQFGLRKTDVDAFLALGVNGAVGKLLDASNDAIPSPPLNVYSTAQDPDPSTPFGQTWVNAPVTTVIPPQYYQARTDTLKAWWVGNMINQKSTLTEKMTLFLFNLIPVEADSVQIAQVTYDYYKLMRDNSLGDYKKILKLISVHPAMLKYLNGSLNAKGAPDENFGRELQELFTIGKGPDSKYTEDDVKAAAKILTGYRINPLTNPVSYYFDFNAHDLSVKRFSSFYNNTTINGKFGPAGEQELDELITMLTNHIETSRHFCRKLYQFFIYYDITPDAEQNFIRPLADFFKSSGFDIKKTIETLFKSQHFYDSLNTACVIKSPLDYAIGICKEFSVQFPNNTIPLDQYIAWGTITSLAAYQGLNIADPPAVAGWQAWYQAPQFHEIWINADSLASRNRVAENITSAKGIQYNAVTILKMDPTILTAQFSNPENALELVKEAVDFIYNFKLSDTSYLYFKNFLISGLPNDSYWTEAWLDFKGNPNDPVKKNTVSTRLSAMYREIISQAEYHLS